MNTLSTDTNRDTDQSAPLVLPRPEEIRRRLSQNLQENARLRKLLRIVEVRRPFPQDAECQHDR